MTPASGAGAFEAAHTLEFLLPPTPLERPKKKKKKMNFFGTSPPPTTSEREKLKLWSKKGPFGKNNEMGMPKKK